MEASHSNLDIAVICLFYQTTRFCDDTIKSIQVLPQLLLAQFPQHSYHHLRNLKSIILFAYFVLNRW